MKIKKPQHLDRADLKKASVKRMHRPHRQEQELSGRLKLQRFFHAHGYNINLFG